MLLMYASAALCIFCHLRLHTRRRYEQQKEIGPLNYMLALLVLAAVWPLSTLVLVAWLDE